jgi:very-short-patch-repair endonuclease
MADERAQRLRTNMTDAESKLWRYLRLRQLEGHKFRRQVPIGPYIADFVCLKAQLVIEVDGGQHAEAQAYDSRRDDFMRGQGYRTSCASGTMKCSQTSKASGTRLCRR